MARPLACSIVPQPTTLPCAPVAMAHHIWHTSCVFMTYSKLPNRKCNILLLHSSAMRTGSLTYSSRTQKKCHRLKVAIVTALSMKSAFILSPLWESKLETYSNHAINLTRPVIYSIWNCGILKPETDVFRIGIYTSHPSFTSNVWTWSREVVSFEKEKMHLG
jgi:hypothetical protein